MKRYKIVVIFSLGILLLGGCNKRTVDQNGGSKYPVRFAGQTVIPPAQSNAKVTGTNFDAGDQIGIYSYVSGTGMFDPGEYTHGNVPYVFQPEGELLVSEGWTPIYFPADEALLMNFVGYYPYTEAMAADGTLPVDLTNQTTQLATAILYSNNARDVVRTADYVPLEFHYLMAQVFVNITFDKTAIPNASISEISSVTLSGTGMQSTCTFQVQDGTLLTTGDQASGYRMMPAVERTGATIIPQYVADPTLTIETPYHTFVAHPNPITYEPGLQYTYNLTLRGAGEVSIGSTVIEPWVPGNDGIPPITGVPE